MKTEELMIDDWVTFSRNNKYYKVSSLTSDIELEGYGFIFNCLCDDVEPIPLTAVILEEIGFWYEQNVGYVMEEDEYEIIYDLWDHKLRILKNREQILSLEYFNEMCVHELQHALRLCNIEKEIEL